MRRQGIEKFISRHHVPRLSTIIGDVAPLTHHLPDALDWRLAAAKMASQFSFGAFISF